MNILVRKNDRERGPYTEAELRERLKSGVFLASDLGQIEGESNWKPLSEILLASVLAAEKLAEAPAATPARSGTYLWMRQPKVIGGAIVLLLLTFGGINWLNKASEKRRAEAAAARQAAAMEQAQKQEAALLQKQQERADQARQAQLDQVKQLMAYSEKAQKEYQEKEKQRLAEQEKARQKREQEEQQKRREALRQEEEQRRRAAAEEKRQQEQRVVSLGKTRESTATPASIGHGVAPWRDAQDAGNYVLSIGGELWDVAVNQLAGKFQRWSGKPQLVANHPDFLFFCEKEKMTTGFTASPPHLVPIGNSGTATASPPIDNSASDRKADVYMASDNRRMVLIENGDIWRGEFDWAKNEVVNKKRLTTNGLFGDKRPVLWHGNTLYIKGEFSKEKPIVKLDLVSGALEEIPTYDVFESAVRSADGGMFVNPTGDLVFFPHGDVMNTYDARAGKAKTVRNTVDVRQNGRPAKMNVVTQYTKLGWIDPDTLFCHSEAEGLDSALVRLNVRTGASSALDQQRGSFEEVTILPGAQFAEIKYVARDERTNNARPPVYFLIDVANGAHTKLPYSPEMPRHWLDEERCIYGKTSGGINEVGTWLFNRNTGESKKLCSIPCDSAFAMLLRERDEVCFSATINGQHLCRVKLNGEDFTQLACGEYAEAIDTRPIDLGLDPNSTPLWQPVSYNPQQSPQSVPKPQQASPDKPGDWITVMEAIKDEPPEMQEWARRAYDYATINRFLNDFYDPAKLTLKFLSAHRVRPEAAITDIVSKTDYKECVFRPKVEQWAYLRTFDIMGTKLPPDQLEKVAEEVGRLVADAYVADPKPVAAFKERLYNNALRKALHTVPNGVNNPMPSERPVTTARADANPKTSAVTAANKSPIAMQPAEASSPISASADENSQVKLPDENRRLNSQDRQSLNHTEPDLDDSLIAEKIVQSFSEGDVETLASLYANTVDYMDSGRITSANVRSQISEYFAKWPVRRWELVGQVNVDHVGPSAERVVFSAHYDVSNPDTNRHTAGTAKETLVIASDTGGAMKIISHQEKISSGNRSDTAPSNGRQRQSERQRIYDGRPVISPPPNIPWPPGIPHP